MITGHRFPVARPEKPGRGLFVCSMNRAPHPPAGPFFRRPLREPSVPSALLVESAGLAATDGDPVLRYAQRVARESGLDLASHRSRRLRVEWAADADLILVMTEAHRAQISGCSPDLASRTFTMREVARLLNKPPPPSPSLRTALSGLDERRSQPPRPVAPEDIPDPAGQPLQEFRALAEELERLSAHIARRLLDAVDARDQL